MAARLPFVKANALGNDFVIMEEAGAGTWDTARLARQICDRHAGVGADGLLLVRRGIEQADAQVRTINSDGSEAELSGNGLRCVAAWLVGEGSVGQRIALNTRAGIRVYTLLERRGSRYTFDSAMGDPVFEPERVPFHPEHAVQIPVVGYPLKIAGAEWRATVLSMGNPQCVFFVEDFEQTDWRAVGRQVERHPCFPERTNVAFVRVLGAGRIAARFWERGAGETQSSGTGCCAAAVAAILAGLNRGEVFVEVPGGEMRVHWSEGDQVYLTGTAELVAEGQFIPGNPVRGS